jgi:uncharacterized protein YutE (UPF0331/DUF86 family)
LVVNPDRIRRISSEILAAIRVLEDLSAMSRDSFLADLHRVASAKYHFIVAIEGALDLCNHAIAKNGLRTPEDFADTFRVMREEGAFDEEFTTSLIQMARFRNRLVHIHGDVDGGTLLDILTQRIPDLRRFLRDYGTFIQR